MSNNSVDFSSLLNKPADDIKRPVPLPAGTYTGSITQRNYDKSSQKGTPFVKLTIQNLDIDSRINDVDLADLADVDLSTKTINKTFYLSEGAQYMLKEFAETCGIITSGMNLGQICDELIGKRVVCEVIQRPSERDKTVFFNEVEAIRGDD